jgi:hypothetical protein
LSSLLDSKPLPSSKQLDQDLADLQRRRRRLPWPGYRFCDLDRIEPVPASGPTRHQPGSRGKLKVMRQRLARREELFHPLDAGSTPAMRLLEALREVDARMDANASRVAD